LIRNHPKLGQVLTLEGWCLYLTCPTGTSQWDEHNLSQWDRQIGTSCLSQWDKHSLFQLGLGKVKRDLSLSHGTSHIPTLEAFPCPGTSSLPTMELVPVPLVPTCPTKWVYKAVKFTFIYVLQNNLIVRSFVRSFVLTPFMFKAPNYI